MRLALFFAGAALLAAQNAPLLEDAQLKAIVEEASGRLALDTIVALSQSHRVHASPGFHEAASLIVSRARAYGLKDVRIEEFPADGKTTYRTFRSYLGWEASAGVLREISPQPAVIADYSKMRVALADYSNDADVTAALADVGPGTSRADYAGKEVKGKIVLAGGDVAAVHREAVEERGAAGILSYQPNQVTGWSGDYPDLVRWGHLSPYNTKNSFAFMISLRRARAYRERLARGERIELHALVKARVTAGAFEVVTGVIPGTDPTAGEIVFSSHLCHQQPGANDDASGAATILEDARLLTTLIESGRLARPRRTIRFIWPPEIAGTLCWFTRHPDVVKRMKAAIHMDMVGGDARITKAILHVTHTPASLPSYVNDVAQAFGEYVIEGSRRMAMDGNPADAILEPGGNKEPLIADFTPYSMGSDHDVYEEGSFRVPTIYLRDWPDVFIHTDQDAPANMDITKLKRVAVIGAASGYFLASAGDREAEKLAGEVFARGGARQSEALRRALAIGDVYEARNLVREAARQEREALASVAELGVVRNLDGLIGRVAAREAGALELLPAAPARSGARLIPRRLVAGNLHVYYYDYLADHKPGAQPALAGTLAYEALNLVDGRRSVGEIRDILSAQYQRVEEGAVRDYLMLLASIGVVRFD